MVRMGSCSWKYPSWAGLVYSRAEKINYLAEYSRKYETVEIDQWFWSLFGPGKVSLPDLNTAAEYAASAPENFSFTTKVANSITLTHFYPKKGDRGLVANDRFLSADLMRSFLERIAPIRDRTAAVMFQFEYLNRQKISGAAEFLSRFDRFLSEIPEGWLYAIETRNPNYLSDRYFEFLAKHKLIMVFCQGYYMPPVTELYQRYGTLLTGRVVIRLMGPDRGGIEEQTGGAWSSLVAPKDEELRGIAAMIEDLVSRGIDVIVNVNNHYEGSAPLTIGRLSKLLGMPDPAARNKTGDG